MPTSIILALAVLPFLAETDPLGDAIGDHLVTTEVYDKIRDVTTLRLNLGTVEDTPKTHLIAIILRAHQGKGRKTIPTTALIFGSYNEEDWRFREDHTVILLAGENRIRIEPEWSAVPKAKNPTELLVAPLSPESLRLLCRAETIDIGIGNKDFKLTAAQVAAMKEFHRYVDDPELVARAPTPEIKEGNAVEAKKDSQTPEEIAKAKEAEAKKTAARAESRLKMAAALERQKKIPGAVKLYQEIVKDYPGTSQARTAAERVKALGGK